MEVESSPKHEATAYLYIVHGAAYVSQHVKNPSKGPEIGRSTKRKKREEVEITIELRYEPPFFQWIMETFRSTQWLEEAISKVADYSHVDGQEAPLSNRETRQKIWSHQGISDSVYFSKEIDLSKKKSNTQKK